MKTISPLAGEAMALRSVKFIRGINNPPELPDTSSTALGCGVVVPMPTVWENSEMGKLNVRRKKAVTLIDLSLRWMIETDTRPQQSGNRGKQASSPQI